MNSEVGYKKFQDDDCHDDGNHGDDDNCVKTTCTLVTYVLAHCA